MLADCPRLLIVDDDPTSRALLETIFRGYGFTVACTDSALGGNDLVQRFQPAVILLDLALPFRSGASWLTQLKADPRTMRIPVVVLSTIPEVLPLERRELAAAIVKKPFRAQLLVGTVQALCRDPRAPAPAEATTATASTRPLELLGSSRDLPH